MKYNALLVEVRGGTAKNSFIGMCSKFILFYFLGGTTCYKNADSLILFDCPPILIIAINIFGMIDEVRVVLNNSNTV